MSKSVAVALGGGAARGWAHIGVLQALDEAGIRPDVVCGTSMGSLIGAIYACGRLPELTEWALELDWWQIVRLSDAKLQKGGFVSGERLMEFLRRFIHVERIEDLPLRFGAVATDLVSGHEHWLREGPLVDAVRASIALPGLLTPVVLNGRWYTDGGLVNPVPVSLCRALGAEVVIAVNVNGDLVGHHFNPRAHPPAVQEDTDLADWPLIRNLIAAIPEDIKQRARPYLNREEELSPGLLDVLAGSLNIMQDRITRSRMAGDPPEIQVTPRLAHIDLLAFDKADQAIAIGRRAMEPWLEPLRNLL